MTIFTSLELRDKISFWFKMISLEVENDNNKGLYDINKCAEGFFCKLFNLIYSNYSLEELKHVNEAAIDLGDKNNKLCMQVTAIKRTDKIQKTITTFEKNELNKIYNHLRFFLLVLKKQKKYIVQTNGLYAFNSDDDILDINDLIKYISNTLDYPTQEKVFEFLSKELSFLYKKYGENNISIETKLFQELFRVLYEENNSEISNHKYAKAKSDLEKKKIRFNNFWEQIESNYKLFINPQRELRFQQAMNHFSEPNIIKVHNYLRSISNDALYANNGDPIKSIEYLIEKIKKDNDLEVFSIMDIKYFLYFQLFNCYVFPNIE